MSQICHILYWISEEGTQMKMERKRLAVAVAVVASVASSGALGGEKTVMEYKPDKRVLKMVKDDGSVTKRKLVRRPTVKLVDRKGNVTVADINELATAGTVLRLKRKATDPKKVKKVVLRELRTGSSDCSFDAMQYKDVRGSKSFDWGCSADLSTELESVSKSCDFDASIDVEPNERDMDMSGSCDYERETPDSSLAWDCSFDGSTSFSRRTVWRQR